MLHNALIEADIAFKCKTVSGCFWMGAAADSPDTVVLDVAFVDDEAIIILAKILTELIANINAVLKDLLNTLDLLNMTVNLSKGKRDTLLRYSGKGATEAYEQLRTKDGLFVDVQCRPGTSIHIVQEYKHLGSVINVKGSLAADGKHK
eukprot:5305154-Karenia_brevis.AAC.1